MKVFNIADHPDSGHPDSGHPHSGKAKKARSGKGSLRADNIGKIIGKKQILQSVSLTLNEGEVVGLLGPNGAGKTTAFYIMTGLLAPDYGTLHLDGQDVTRMSMYRRCRMGLGYLPQETSIFQGLSVEENIYAILEFTHKDRAKCKSILEELLEEFSIAHLRRASTLSLSGGERRRVEIARSLASDPRYILLDEPLAGIDPVAVKEICDLIFHLKKRGIGIFLTDHNARETLSIADRAYILHNGQVLVEGHPSTIISDRDARRVYLGEHFSV